MVAGELSIGHGLPDRPMLKDVGLRGELEDGSGDERCVCVQDVIQGASEALSDVCEEGLVEL